MGKRQSLGSRGIFVDKRAIIDAEASIGSGTKVWAFAQIGAKATVGKNCVIGNGAYIDRNVVIGNNVKIHNKALLYHGLIVEDNCFIGPGACFTNDKYPKHNITRDLKETSWRVKRGASIGANATILPDITIGENAVVGAGCPSPHSNHSFLPARSKALGSNGLRPVINVLDYFEFEYLRTASRAAWRGNQIDWFNGFNDSRASFPGRYLFAVSLVGKGNRVIIQSYSLAIARIVHFGGNRFLDKIIKFECRG